MKKAHQEITHFPTRDNQFLFANRTAASIENIIGATPFYVYDKHVIRKRIEQLRSSLPSNIKLHYAIKANPFPPLVSFISHLVDGFDVASKEELLLALQSDIANTDISFAGPGKHSDDLLSAITAGAIIHVESPNELNQISTIAKQQQLTPKIAIRVNPEFELKQAGMQMAGGAKPFGIDQAEVFELLKRIEDYDVELIGFHIFAGSQNLNEQAIIEAHERTFELAEKLLQASPTKINYVNIGGGFGIPYFPGEKSINLDLISDNLNKLNNQYSKTLNGIELIIELGRFIVGESGVYVSKIIDIKQSHDKTYLVCDGGMHHHLANSGNFGQVIRKNYPVKIANKLDSEFKQEVEIVGPLCTPLDILGSKIQVPKDTCVGDYVAVFQSGAYGASASPQKFLSQRPLGEILL